MQLSFAVQAAVVDALAAHVGRPVTLERLRVVGGGSIHAAFQLDTDAGAFFLKQNTAAAAANFAAEAEGLRTLMGRSPLHVPAPIGHGTAGAQAWLLMAWLAARAPATAAWTRLGEGLAALHRHTQAQFGFHQDNYIGSLPQRNTPCTNWLEFWVAHRLQPQAALASARGRLDTSTRTLLDRVIARLPELLPVEPPALLHGDLWSGNVLLSTGPDGVPAIFDPAVHYGHREADLAMTVLFGGFESEFYAAYAAHYPLVPGWRERLPLHNLYPLMVHLNLFGTGYLPQIQAVLRRHA
jgi:fructosamine-3-kinase